MNLIVLVFIVFIFVVICRVAYEVVEFILICAIIGGVIGGIAGQIVRNMNDTKEVVIVDNDVEFDILIDEINNSNDDIGEVTDGDDMEGFTSKPNHQATKFEKQHSNEYDIEIYSGVDDIRKLYTHMGSNGDTQICNRMKYMGVQPKLSQDIRASYNKYSQEPFFTQELEEQSNKIWWENDLLDIHT